MVMYEPTSIHDDLGRLNMATWIPAPNSSDYALRPVDDQIEGGAMSCCICVDDDDPRIAHFWSRISDTDSWEFVQGFAENEEIYCTQDSTVVEDKVLLSSTTRFFSATVQKQLESWLMVMAVCKANTDGVSEPDQLDLFDDDGVADATFDSGTFPTDGVHIYESEDDGDTWNYKGTVTDLPPTHLSYLENADDLMYPLPFNFGSFPTPSRIEIALIDGATPSSGYWYVHVPCQTATMTQEYQVCIDAFDNPVMADRTRYETCWSPAGFVSADNGANWSQIVFKETFYTPVYCADPEGPQNEVELFWEHFEVYGLDTGTISRNLWLAGGEGPPVASMDARTAFQTPELDGFSMESIIESTTDMTYYWGHVLDGNGDPTVVENDYPDSSPGYSERKYLFIHGTTEYKVIDYDPDVFGWPDIPTLSGDVVWSNPNVGQVGSTNIYGPNPCNLGQPLWVKLRDHAVVLEAEALFSVENAPAASTDGWSVGFLPGGS